MPIEKVKNQDIGAFYTAHMQYGYSQYSQYSPRGGWQEVVASSPVDAPSSDRDVEADDEIMDAPWNQLL